MDDVTVSFVPRIIRIAPAAIGFFAYLYVYLYERGYCYVFKIPYELISLSITTILSAVFGLLVVIALFWVVVHFLPSSLQNMGDLRYYTWAGDLFAFACAYLLFALVDVQMPIWYWPIFFLAGPLLVAILSLFLKWPKLEYKPWGSSSLYWKILQSAPRSLVFAGIFALYGLGLAYNAGKEAARTQNSFLVTKTKPAFVALRFYGDTVILVAVDLGTGTIGRSFRIEKLSAVQPLDLRLVRIIRTRM